MAWLINLVLRVPISHFTSILSMIECRDIGLQSLLDHCFQTLSSLGTEANGPIISRSGSLSKSFGCSSHHCQEDISELHFPVLKNCPLISS